MISVALASFNGARHIAAQLDSLRRQTRPPDQLVVSDDGSSDGTQQIVRDFARTASFQVVLIDQSQQLGVADNFLAAAGACSGDHIAFCDQDDIWLPEKLSRAETALKDGCSLFVHQSIVVDSELRRLAPLDQRLRRQGSVEPLTLDAYDLGYGHCMVFDRRLLQVGNSSQRPPQPRGRGRMAHDHWIMQLATLLGGVLISDEALTLYRQHAHNVVGSAKIESNTLGDFARPALADYVAERDLYEGLLQYFSPEVADAAAQMLGGRVSAARVRGELDRRRRRLEARIDLYTQSSLGGRLSAFGASLRTGWGARAVPRRDLLLTLGKDALFGVVAKRRTTR